MSTTVEPIEKGGSGRKFWRIRTSAGADDGGGSCILIRYSLDRADNAGYADIASFLTRVGVRVPGIFLHDPAEGVMVMEDVGDTDLFSFRAEPWPERRRLYELTLAQAALLHTRAHLAGDRPPLQQRFDEALYAWEQDYFIEHCLGRHFKMSAADIAAHVDHTGLREIAAQLADEPRCLVHRDFQSQNVIIRDGLPTLIDFQGLRPGLAQYDLASLLLDPYVSLSASERDALFAHYLTLAQPENPAHFRALHDLCAMQRLMQALGAYGKLGHTDGRAHFLTHIPAAIALLREVLAKIAGMEKLAALLGQVAENNSQPPT
ncbi:MAG: phosphotransferase [Chthoniobacteraceae bacterium]